MFEINKKHPKAITEIFHGLHLEFIELHAHGKKNGYFEQKHDDFVVGEDAFQHIEGAFDDFNKKIKDQEEIKAKKEQEKAEKKRRDSKNC